MTNPQVAERYPGYIMRQSLVDFCQDKQDEITSKRKEYQAFADDQELPEDVVATFDNADYLEMGRQQAFREVCEWARGHLVPPLGVKVAE